MAIIHQAPGQGLVQQPAQAFIDTSPKRPIFRDGVSARQSSLDPAKSFEKYFGRVHRRYKSMDTTNIENLANRLLQENNPTLTKLVKEKIFLRDTFKNRFIEAKTPLGEVLQELQNSQESPNRKLLSKEIFRQAEKEAQELTEKEVALAAKKGSWREVSNEISHLLKRQTAVGKIGPEFHINTYTTGAQIGSSTTSLSNGKFVVTWDSWMQDGDKSGVYGQIFNADGIKSGSEFQVNTYTIDSQGGASTASLSNDKFVVTWMSLGQDGDGWGIYGQIFNEDGTKGGSEFQINTYTTGYQSYSSVANLSNGKFVVTWQSEGQDGSNYSIYGQLFNADGTKNGLEFQVNSYTRSYQRYPSATNLSNGKFVIAWDGWKDGSSGVYGQIFNEDGTKSGSEFQINTYTTSSQEAPSVASLSNGKFVVTWESYEQDGDDSGVYGQVFNADGTKSGSEFQINTYTTGYQGLLSTASLDDNKFVVTWVSGVGQDGDLHGIYGQIFNENGIKSGSEFQINTYTTGAQMFPSAAGLDNNKFVVTWSSAGDGDIGGIYGQIFGTDIRDTTSGAERQTTSIALTAFAWMTQTIKGALGY